MSHPICCLHTRIQRPCRRINEDIQLRSRAYMDKASELIRSVDMDELVTKAKELSVDKQARHEEAISRKPKAPSHSSKRVSGNSSIFPWES